MGLTHCYKTTVFFYIYTYVWTPFCLPLPVVTQICARYLFYSSWFLHRALACRCVIKVSEKKRYIYISFATVVACLGTVTAWRRSRSTSRPTPWRSAPRSTSRSTSGDRSSPRHTIRLGARTPCKPATTRRLMSHSATATERHSTVLVMWTVGWPRRKRWTTTNGWTIRWRTETSQLINTGNIKHKLC